jgi:Arc/MetJ family transcription regulator
MPTNLAIDDQLLEEAKRVGRFRTKKETVTTALEELIQRRQQHKLLKLFGTVDFREDWDYKKERRDRGPRR